MNEKYRKSADLYERAHLIAGRSLTRSKAPGKMYDRDAGPLYAVRGQGALLTDVDGHQFIDMVCGLGAISLGYGEHPVHIDTTVMSLPSETEVLAAEAFVTTVTPWATSIRFTKTGSEALQAAAIVARAATGRDNILVADNSYHGWHSTFQAVHATAPGIPALLRNTIAAYRYGSIKSLDAVARAIGSVAAVFVEPARWEPANPDNFLGAVRQWCSSNGALMVTDEMIYGGRFSLGGSIDAFVWGIPDLACYGKAFGNGAPIACVVGNHALRAYGELVSGTYSGDAHGLQSLLNTVRAYGSLKIVRKIREAGRRLQDGLREAVEVLTPGVAHLEGAAVHQRIRFTDPLNGKLFAAEMVKRGVLWHPECVNVSAAHTDKIIDHVAEAALISMVKLKMKRGL